MCARKSSQAQVDEIAAYFEGSTVEPKRKTKRRFSKYEFMTTYPDENPENALQEITKTLSYVGFFDGMKKDGLT